MAGADTTSGMLVSAGYEEIALHRRNLPVVIGHDLDEAIALREGLSEFQEGGRICAPASVWIVTATAP